MKPSELRSSIDWWNKTHDEPFKRTQWNELDKDVKRIKLNEVGMFKVAGRIIAGFICLSIVVPGAVITATAISESNTTTQQYK